MTTPIPLLSHRERQVLLCVAQGLQNKEIAQRLNLSEHTVEKHLTHIYQKLNVNNRTGASHWFWTNRAYWENNGYP